MNDNINIMKTSINIHLITLAIITSAGCAPMVYAQTPSPDTTQSSKTANSTADKNDATTGTSKTPPDMNNTNSKDTAASVDKNPSQAESDSATKASSKMPPDSSTGTSTEEMSDQAFVMKASQDGMTEVNSANWQRTRAPHKM